MTDPSSSPDSRFPRAARWGLYVVGGIFALVLLVALLLPQFFTSDQLKGYVIPPMEEATGRQVEIDEIGLRVLWTPAVSVSGFRLAEREGYGPEPAVEAGALNVEVALWPLFRGAIEPTAVELVDPVVRYEVAEDGTGNFDDLMAEEDTTEAQDEDRVAVPVSDFRTTGARVLYVDRSTGQALNLDFDARLSALPDGEAYTSAGTVDVHSLRALLPDVRADTMTVTDAQIDYDVRAALGAGRVDVSEFLLQTAPLTVRTTGAITRLNVRPMLDLTIETREADFAQLSAFAPSAVVEDLNPTGTLELTTTVTGPLPDSTGATDSLSVDGTGRLAGIGADYEGEALLRDLEADLALSLDEMALTALQGQLLGASLDGAVRLEDVLGEPAVDLQLETGDLDLSTLASFAPPEQVEGYNPQGRLRLNATVTGPLPEDTDSLDRLTIDGVGQLAGVGVDYDGTAMLRDLGADLSFSGTSASVTSIDGQLLARPVEGEVTVRDLLGAPQVDGRLAGEADLAELSDLAASDAEAEPMEVSGMAEYDVRFAGPVEDPDAIRPTGQVRLADVRYPYESFRHPIEIPGATVELTGTGVSMDRFTLRSGEQEMALQTKIQNLFPISKGLAETDPAMGVDFTFTSERLDLVELYPEEEETDVSYSDLFSATLAGSTVDGESPEALAKKLYGDVELPEYAVDGQVKIDEFHNPPQRVDDLAFDLQLRDRRMKVTDLSGTTYEGQLAGSVTFDQSESSSAAAMTGGESMLMASRGTAAGPAAPPSSNLNYDIELRGARAGAFLEDWTTLGRVVNGTLDFTIDGTSPLSEGLLPLADALTAKGSSVVADGGLSLDLGVAQVLVDELGLGTSFLTEFERFGGPFTIEEGELKVGEWTLGRQATTAQLSGALGLGGSVDLDMQMDLPLSTIQDSNVGRLVGMGDRGSELLRKLTGAGNGDETIPVRVQIGGTMSNPTVEVVDKEAVRSALQDLARKQGLGRLRNLFEGGGK